MMQRVFKRIWCKTCSEFEVHEIGTNYTTDLHCITCGTKYTDVYLSEISSEKLKTQRERYKAQESKRTRDFYTGLLGEPSNLLGELFSEPKTIIQESDAGQKSIDDEIRQERAIRMAEYREKQEKKKKLIEKHKHLTRNDKCLCGSNKKYKHCCLKEIQAL